MTRCIPTEFIDRPIPIHRALRWAVLIAVIFTGIAEGLVQTVQAAADRKPNVVLIMTDDQGYGDLGCHGNKVIRTPAIDKLHAESVRLTNFHVDPTCSPTRSALMTGRYSSRTGVWHTIMGRSIMHADEYTLGELFSDNGYKTAVFGKWHLGDNYPCRPQDQGFQEVLVHGGGGVTQTPDYFGNKYFDDTYWHNGITKKYTGYCTDIFFDGALSFIEKNKDRPFFCYLPTNAAHGPFLVAKKYSDPYKKLGVPSPRAEFYGMITNIDENVARMRKRLKELGLAENTIFIFMTDNGTAAGMGGGGRKKKMKKQPAPKTEAERQARNGYNAGMRGMKGSEYEGGHRVPFFIHWPKGALNREQDVHHLTAHIDVFPTLADLCGLKIPSEMKLDGNSLKEPLLGIIDRKWPARTLVVHSQRIESPQKFRKAAVMTDRWRLVLNGKTRELYDIKDDPGQKKDVKAEHPKTFKILTAAYEKWYAGIGTRFNDYVRITLGSEHENPARLTCHDWHTHDKPVPWHQNSIRSDQKANGFWAVHIAKAGIYEFTLRTRPARLKAKIPAGIARITIGDKELSRKIADGDTEITFRTALPAGDAKLQTWFEDGTAKSRGAYFVHVCRVDGKKTAAIRISRKTTFLTAPVGKDGYIDYAAALNTKYSKGVTTKNNAAVVFAEILGPKVVPAEIRKEFYARLGIPVPPMKGRYFLNMSDFATHTAGKNAEAYIIELGKEYDQATARPWSRKEFPKVAAWLDHNQRHVAAILNASQRTRWYQPIVLSEENGTPDFLMNTNLPLSQEARGFVRLLTARAMLSVHEEKIGEAQRDLLTCHRLARLVGEGPWIIDALIGIALDSMVFKADTGLLQSEKLTVAQLNAWQKTLDALPPLPAIAPKLDYTERIVVLDAATIVARSGPDGFDQIGKVMSLSSLSDLAEKLAGKALRRAFLAAVEHFLRPLIGAAFWK